MTEHDVQTIGEMLRRLDERATRQSYALGTAIALLIMLLLLVAQVHWS